MIQQQNPKQSKGRGMMGGEASGRRRSKKRPTDEDKVDNEPRGR